MSILYVAFGVKDPVKRRKEEIKKESKSVIPHTVLLKPAAIFLSIISLVFMFLLLLLLWLMLPWLLKNDF